MRHRPSLLVGLVAALLLPGPLFAAQSLLEAAREGEGQAALALVRSGADARERSGDGTTALHWAAYHGDEALARALVRAGADVNARNDYGSTPLQEAAERGYTGVIRVLLKARADPESANPEGQTALMTVARVGNVEAARLLIKAGADVNAVEGWRGQTALMWAAGNARPEVVEFLVRQGADVHARAVHLDWGNQVTSEPRAQYRPSGGQTVLLYAARAGCVRCVDALLAAGAGIDVPTPDGVTPLMSAIDNMHFDLARHLLDKGANPHLSDWWGRTALYVATDVHQLTSRAGAVRDPGAVKDDRHDALDIMRLLLDAGVDPNPQLNMHRPGRGGNSGRFTDDLLTVGATPLMRAAVCHDIPAMELLLQRGAMVDLPNGMGATPLMAAAGMGVSSRDPRCNYTASDTQQRAIETLKVLLAAGADINARMTDTSSHTARIARPSTVTKRQGQTAIFGAINWGWPQVVQFLLDNGARVDIVDAEGKTVLDELKGAAGGRDPGGRDPGGVQETAELITRVIAGARS